MIKHMQPGLDMVHTKHGVIGDAKQFPPQIEDAIGGQKEGEPISSTKEEQGVPSCKRTVVIYNDGASKYADEVGAFFQNQGSSIQRLQYHNAETFTDAIKTDCSRMFVLIEERFAKLLEDDYRICTVQDALQDLVKAEKDVHLIRYLDDDETYQEVKYKLPKAMRKKIVHHSQFLKSTNGYVAYADRPTSAAQVGDHNQIEVNPDANNIVTLQVGRDNTFYASSGPTVEGYELTIKTPAGADYELCTEIKKHIDSNIAHINISLEPLNTRVVSTDLGSVIIRVSVEPRTKLGPVWLREVISKILSEDIFAKLPKGTRMEISMRASLPLTPLDVDVFELNDEKWISDYTSDITKKNETGRSMLHEAARLGNRSVVILCIKSGCNVNDQDMQGNTALHYAVMSEENSASVSGLLIDGGASIELVNRDGFTPLHCAVANRNLEIIELCAAKFGIKESNPTSSNHTDTSYLTQLMVKQGADVNALNKDKLTPLQVAALWQSFDVIAVLLTKGADANVVDRNGQTPLHHVFGLDMSDKSIDAATWAFGRKEASRKSHVAPPSVDTNKPSGAPSSVFDIPDREGNTPLHSALSINFTQGAITLVRAGASVNTKNNVKNTPLHILGGNTNMANTHSGNDAVKKLIECSRDVNVKDDSGNTPLIIAVQNNKDISPLLEAGAEVNAENRFGDTAIHKAVTKKNTSPLDIYDIDRDMAELSSLKREGESKLIPMLIAGGANVNGQDSDGNTPLMMTATTGHDISPLLTAGADVNSKNKYGETALHRVFEDHHRSSPRNISKLIEAGADVNSQDNYGNTPLMMAVVRCSDISSLLTAGAEVNTKNKSGETALHLVCEDHHRSSPRNISKLIEAGADVNTQDNDGNTPLMMAVVRWSDISSLLTAGAEVNTKNKSGKTALHLVFKDYRHSYPRSISELIEAGPDVNSQDNDGKTPLMMVVETRSDVSPLLTAEADVHTKEISRKIVLHCVVKDYRHSYQRNISKLIEAGADVNTQDNDGNTPLMMAVMILPDISPLLTAGAEVNTKNKSGKTALHLVFEDHHRPDLMNISKLIEAGADVNSQDDDGNTPLMMAVKTKSYISLLLTAGAEVNTKNKSGKTALHLVFEDHDRPDPRNISKLIEAGADVNTQDDDGKTPLMMAVKTGSDISLLLTAGAEVNTKNKSGTTALHLVPADYQYTRVLSTSEPTFHRHVIHAEDWHCNTVDLDVRGTNFPVFPLIAAGADVNAQDDDGNGVLP